VTATLARVAEIFTAIGPNLQPKYSNLGYQLLGEIVHRASGTPYTTYVQQEILRPLGLADTAFEPLPGSLRARCATGYSARTFSDELTLAPDITAFAEGGLWSTAHDLARWLSFQLSAHADEPQDSPVLAAASLREMHKPRYLSDETWTQAWGISWYAVRKDDVTWVQHSGGLHGFTSGACFDRDKRVGAVVFVNGIGDAPGVAMELASAARGQVPAQGPRPPASTPAEYAGLLGLYVVPSYGEVIRIEWRDGKLTVLNSQHEEQHLTAADGADTFTVGPGFRASGETVRFRRLADGRIAGCFFGGETLVRLSPVDPA
jgi:CubicO group peptidase (beta-lactamase class C family)